MYAFLFPAGVADVIAGRYSMSYDRPTRVNGER